MAKIHARKKQLRKIRPAWSGGEQMMIV